ncbi:hypothetical protein LTR91_009625 [Friedmanniomyces endolithicus]|uniref:Uncharacterized protein n=1 Tax=Friedmanniomyces endolithicus TaxID=329885 RepID=A0AAN6KL46_9PEZI|nr:hypothetical protein LTS00_004215 [Friedmanniomyces endolithicus]KAK0304415.1 hypothetical protein LTR01_007517 [Friedmanniomyces endolithicus]KAK0833568.1 hypothetical protein LTR73_001330 [Friedmanniomyces endolithicus]KAK0907304.1 hypothetical protein LTR57_017330 [Friedmanniomyces endolithicus]KAK0983721.1 hypothetical protein LTS01_010989 [Friedmanniomyces endolithicus]
MVSTRHSLPSTTDDALALPTTSSTSPPPPTQAALPAAMTAKQSRLLRSLRIDAHDAIIAPTIPAPRTRASTGGGGVTGAGGMAAKVYHYRGAVYELQGDEPDEWMEAERETERKRQSRVSWDVSAGKGGVGSAVQDDEHQTRKKRRMSNDGDDDSLVDAGRKRKHSKQSGDREGVEDADEEQPRRKSRQVAAVKSGDEYYDEQEQARKRRRSAQLAEARAIKKRKRSQNGTSEADDETHNQRADSAAPPSTRQLPAVRGHRGPISKPRTYRPAPRPTITMDNPGVSSYDLTINGGHETETCGHYARMAAIRDARDRAANEGLQVRMLPKETMMAGRRWHVAQLMRELIKVNRSVREHEEAMAKLKGQMEERKRRESVKAGSNEASASASASAPGALSAGAVTARPSTRIDSPLANGTTNAFDRASKFLDPAARPTSASRNTGIDAPSPAAPVQHNGNRSILQPAITPGRAESLLRGGRFSGESADELAVREQEEEAWLTGWMTRER